MSDFEVSSVDNTGKKQLLGLQSLVKFPTARAILVHGQDDFAAAQRMFPQNPVLAWEGGTGALSSYYLGHLETRPSIIWDTLPVAPVLKELERQLAVAGINGGSQIAIFAPTNPMECYGVAEAETHRLPRQWIVPRLRPYVPVAATEPAVPTPAAVVEPVARPVASVTPITEARTRQQAKPAVDPALDYTPFADDSLAKAFTAANPQLRYVSRWSKWLEWTDAGWVEDSTLHVYDMARLFNASIADAHVGKATPSAIAACKSVTKRAAVESLAKADRAHASSPELWDANEMSLNTPGGLVDLSTGNVRPVRLDDYCLKMAAATPRDVPTPVFSSFLRYGTDGDADLAGFLQRWFGMNMTGLTREQKFVFIHGRGGAGKGTLLNMIARILGTYARKIKMETFTEQPRAESGSSHNEDIARLAGSRMGYAAETQQGKRWNEARIKELTGEDIINARMPYAPASFEFRPQIKLTIMGNHPPGLRSVGNEMRRRLLIVPFDHLPPVPDPLLADKLWAERDGIAYWLLVGALAWQCDGLLPPTSVVKASAEYFENQDTTGQWIADCCETGTGCETSIRALHKSYHAYLEPTGYQALRQGELRDELYSRGYKRGGYDSAPTIKGIRVRVDTSSQNARFPGSD